MKNENNLKNNQTKSFITWIQWIYNIFLVGSITKGFLSFD
jgi:hypothetical protein